jgi:mono/diheme cytochrome c family protein
MNSSLEIRASVLALTAALLSLGGAVLLGKAIQLMPGAASPMASGPASAPAVEISTSPEVVHQGANYFAMSCTECHGDDAHGDEGPDLHNLAISNARIATTIRKGIKGEMPTFAKKYNDAQIAAVVSYLRTLH